MMKTQVTPPLPTYPATRTEHVHPERVRPDVDYFYRVRAINSAGKGMWSPSSGLAID